MVYIAALSDCIVGIQPYSNQLTGSSCHDTEMFSIKNGFGVSTAIEGRNPGFQPHWINVSRCAHGVNQKANH